MPMPSSELPVSSDPGIWRLQTAPQTSAIFMDTGDVDNAADAICEGLHNDRAV